MGEKTEEKVEITKNQKEKKKMKLGTKICIIVLIILAILLIDMIRKFVIIRGIDEQYAKDRMNKNHYYKVMNIEGGKEEIYVYNNIKILKNISYTASGKEEKQIYMDEDKKEQWIIVSTPSDRIAVKVNYQDMGMVGANNGGLPGTENVWAELMCAVMANIESDKWNGQDCYLISFDDEYQMWVNKNDKRIIGSRNGTFTNKDGDEVNQISSFFYKYGELTEKDVEFPDLTGYTVKDSKGNIIDM